MNPPDPATPDPAAPDFVVVDVETACSRVSSICQIGIVGFRNGREMFAYETLIDPCDDFHVFNTRIHGIAAHHVAGQPLFAHVHAVIDGHLAGRTTVAHSLFDKGALAAACQIHACPPIATTWLDSVRVARRAWPDLASHKLNILSRHLGIAHRHHDALSDARAAGWVVVKAIDHTGIALADWLTPPPRAKQPPAPRPAAAGPLRGERIALLGTARDGPLAQAIAGAGGRIVASVGCTTTLLVIAGEHTFGRYVRFDPLYLKAEAARRGGQAIAIVAEDELRERIAQG